MEIYGALKASLDLLVSLSCMNEDLVTGENILKENYSRQKLNLFSDFRSRHVPKKRQRKFIKVQRIKLHYSYFTLLQ